MQGIGRISNIFIPFIPSIPVYFHLDWSNHNTCYICKGVSLGDIKKINIENLDEALYYMDNRSEYGCSKSTH